jgi:hypothetical protein
VEIGCVCSPVKEKEHEDSLDKRIDHPIHELGKNSGEDHLEAPRIHCPEKESNCPNLRF